MRGDLILKETIILESVEQDREIILPIDYNHMVQAMIYNQLEKEVADFLHEEGFRKEKRTYKLFTFSRLLGRFRLDRKKGQIKFIGPIKLIISSPYNDFNNSIGNNILTNKYIRLGNNRLVAKELSVKKERVENQQITIDALSPITVYSTLLREDGRKFTYYFNPKEEDFSRIISENLRNKYKAFYGTEPPKGEVIIESKGRSKMSIINYKGFIIKGYMGRFTMLGPIPLLQLGLDAGIGSKNSQGLGCIELSRR